MMPGAASVQGVQQAARHQNPIIRMAAARALSNMAAQGGTVDALSLLLDDADLGVRKSALKSVNTANIAALKTKVAERMQQESNEALKRISSEFLRKMQ
jgi:HEAT repeat protein